MNPLLLVFGVQSVVRLGRVSEDALEQWARDAEAIFPELAKADLNPEVYVNGFFNKPQNRAFVVGDQAPYAEFWRQNAVVPKPNAVDALFTAAVKINAEEGIDLHRWMTTGAATLVKQWDPARAPLSPWARIVLTAGDIALEYVSVSPGLLGADGKAEKLITAYAANLSDILPDDGSFGIRENFAQRLSGAFLRAGFSTLSRNPEWVVSEDHLQELIRTSVQPLIEALPDSITEQLAWQEVVDAFMGPAAGAVMQTVVKHQTAFLGDDFSPDKALGAVTRALLQTAVADGLRDRFSRQGRLELYRAVLGVAVERPQLFLGDDPSPRDDFARNLLSGFSDVLRRMPPPFDGGVGVALAGAALESIGAHAHRFTERTDPWEQTAADMVRFLTRALADTFQENANLRDAFTRTQLVELGRILLSNTVRSPEMIFGTGPDAWKGVLATVASAMKQDQHLLLEGSDWVEIARVAVDEAAANPARLFRFDPAKPQNVQAAVLIGVLLRAAGAVLESEELGKKTVLHGRVLREAVVIVLRSCAGNPKAARQQMERIGALVGNLNELVARNSERFGSQEWLHMFRRLLSVVLDGGPVPDLTPEFAAELLQEGR